MSQESRLKSRRQEYNRPYTFAGLWILASSGVFAALWLFLGIIPIQKVPFFIVITIMVGIGVGVLIVSRLYPDSD